jgi:catechol 2,3-dioxygenase-like lactoylglutathione lyase family enzyme
MLPIRGLYEVAIPVRQLQRAETFYRDVLGLAVGLRNDRRKWLFLRAEGAAGMVVLQELCAYTSKRTCYDASECVDSLAQS